MGFNYFLSQIPDVQFRVMLKNGKRSSVLFGFDFESLIHNSFKFVKLTLPDIIKSANFERLILELANDRGLNLFHYDVDKVNPNEAFYFINWVRDEIEQINKMESVYLASDPDMELMAAGVSELNQFGAQNIIDGLTKGDDTKAEYYWNKPYSYIFDRQYKMTIENRIQKKLMDIQKNKSKTGKK